MEFLMNSAKPLCKLGCHLRAVLPGSYTIRVVETHDIADPATRACLKAGILSLTEAGYDVFVWACTPCTAGCPWQRVNKTKGVYHGDMEAAETIIDAAADLCERAKGVGGHFAWEWGTRWELCKNKRIDELYEKRKRKRASWRRVLRV